MYIRCILDVYYAYYFTKKSLKISKTWTIEVDLRWFRNAKHSGRIYNSKFYKDKFSMNFFYFLNGVIIQSCVIKYIFNKIRYFIPKSDNFWSKLSKMRSILSAIILAYLCVRISKVKLPKYTWYTFNSVPAPPVFDSMDNQNWTHVIINHDNGLV